MSDMRRSIVIPMYDEAERIAATLGALAASDLSAAEFVVVDDGSTDGSADLARRTLEQLGVEGCVLRESHNGKGAAVIAGARVATGATIAFVDADLSTDVESVQRVIEVAERPHIDVAIGSRRHPESVIVRRQPWQRELAGRGFNLAVRLLGLSRLRDTQCGLKAFSRDAARLALVPTTTTGFAFDVEVVMNAEREGLTIAEVPVRWCHDDGSAVRVRRDLVPVGRDLLALRRRR